MYGHLSCFFGLNSVLRNIFMQIWVDHLGCCLVLLVLNGKITHYWFIEFVVMIKASSMFSGINDNFYLCWSGNLQESAIFFFNLTVLSALFYEFSSRASCLFFIFLCFFIKPFDVFYYDQLLKQCFPWNSEELFWLREFMVNLFCINGRVKNLAKVWESELHPISFYDELSL